MLQNFGTALSREQMKMVKGGDQTELTFDDGDNGGGNSGSCPTACTGTRANNYQGGTCSSSTMPGTGSLPSTTVCRCSVSGGSGC